MLLVVIVSSTTAKVIRFYDKDKINNGRDGFSLLAGGADNGQTIVVGPPMKTINM